MGISAILGTAEWVESHDTVVPNIMSATKYAGISNRNGITSNDTLLAEGLQQNGGQTV